MITRLGNRGVVVGGALATVVCAIVVSTVTTGSGRTSAAANVKPNVQSLERAREVYEARPSVARDSGFHGEPLRHTFPAEMLGPNSTPPISTTELWPIRNGWRVSNHRRLTAVYAGGNGADDTDRSTGRLAIFRQNFIQLTQETDFIDVRGTGPLRITRAPLGRGLVQTNAQRHGKLHFVSKRGAQGVLHLRGDRVTIRR